MSDNCIHGINKLKKPATKVMAPPGGKTQINLFGSQEPAPLTPVNPNQKKRNDSSIFEQAPPATTCNNNNNSVKAPVKAEPAVPAVESAAAPGGGKPSTKVIAPPGGRSSINLFG